VREGPGRTGNGNRLQRAFFQAYTAFSGGRAPLYRCLFHARYSAENTGFRLPAVPACKPAKGNGSLAQGKRAIPEHAGEDRTALDTEPHRQNLKNRKTYVAVCRREREGGTHRQENGDGKKEKGRESIEKNSKNGRVKTWEKLEKEAEK